MHKNAIIAFLSIVPAKGERVNRNKEPIRKRRENKISNHRLYAPLNLFKNACNEIKELYST